MRFSQLGQGALFAVLFLLFFTRCTGMQPNELECEEAVSYLAKCCPTFNPRAGLQCVQDQGCNQTPAISEEQSSCIRAKSCSELVSSGICAAASAPDYEGGDGSVTTDNGSAPNASICQ